MVFVLGRFYIFQSSWVKTVVVRVCERKYSQPQVQHHSHIVPVKAFEEKFLTILFYIGKTHFTTIHASGHLLNALVVQMCPEALNIAGMWMV
jgi:hypothetical protein